MNKTIFFVMLAAMLVAGGCQDPSSDGKMKLSLYPGEIQVTLPPAGKDVKSGTMDYPLITKALSDIIIAPGNIDSTRFDIFKEDLIKALQMLANYGPSTRPADFATNSDKMAYWYNARALWATYLAVKYGQKMKAYYLNTLKNAFYAIKFPVDGKLMTLRDIDDKIFGIGGYLALISAPGALSGRAAIPVAAFKPGDFPTIIQTRFNDFIADRNRFEINVLNMQIIVPRIIWQFREKIMADYQALYPTPQATFLLALSSMTGDLARYRLKNSIGYKCVEAPIKQTLMLTAGDRKAGFLGL